MTSLRKSRSRRRKPVRRPGRGRQQSNGRFLKFAAAVGLAMSLSLLKFVGQASLVDDAMLPS